MNPALIDLLCCPFCGGNLTAERGNGSPSDILHCRCGDYPVVAGIPILKKRVAVATGTRITEVLKLIAAGRDQEALTAVLLPPPPAAATRAPASVQAVRKWRERAARLFSTPVAEMTAYQFIEFFFRRSGLEAWEGYSYFLFRFGMRRHLVPLSFTSLIENPRKPLLDLGCGFGHSTRCLLPNTQGQRVVGIDEEFFGLYVASNWIATDADYVCGAADSALPFRDGALSAAFCTDALQSFTNKLACVRELQRLVLRDGFLVLASLRSKPLKESAYTRMSALPPEGYAALVGDMPHRLVADADVLARYLQKQGPPLGRRPAELPLAEVGWISLVASYRQEVFRDFGAFDDWPHAAGHLTLNPLYREQGRDELGNVQLRRVFPSAWYQEENAVDDHERYLPETLSVREAALTDLARGRRTADVETLIEQCVVIGVPEGYLPPNFSRSAEDLDRTKRAVGGTFYIAEIGIFDLIASLIPPEAAFIVVDDGVWEGEVIAGRRGVPFLERDGKYWGRPADDDTAIGELERLRQAGSTFIVFGSPAMWWLDYYRRFSRYLDATFSCLVKSDDVVVFDLRHKYTSGDRIISEHQCARDATASPWRE